MLSNGRHWESFIWNIWSQKVWDQIFQILKFEISSKLWTLDTFSWLRGLGGCSATTPHFVCSTLEAYRLPYVEFSIIITMGSDISNTTFSKWRYTKSEIVLKIKLCEDIVRCSLWQILSRIEASEAGARAVCVWPLTLSLSLVTLTGDPQITAQEN